MKRPIESDYISLTAYTRALEEYCEALAQPEQKPMPPQLKAMLEEYFDKCFAESAPQRTWVGLTNAEMKQTCFEACSYDPYTIARAIEAKLKEKNT